MKFAGKLINVDGGKGKQGQRNWSLITFTNQTKAVRKEGQKCDAVDDKTMVINIATF